MKEILLLGNPLLYKVSDPVLESEMPLVSGWITNLHETIMQFRNKYQVGRAIAAPQLGIMKRLIYMHIDKPLVFINPELIHLSDEMFELWDDCMSFPNLLVKVKRHVCVTVRYLDENWQSQEWTMKGDLSELMQHEFEHLNGILCTMRAVDSKSFKWRP